MLHHATAVSADWREGAQVSVDAHDKLSWTTIAMLRPIALSLLTTTLAACSRSQPTPSRSEAPDASPAVSSSVAAIAPSATTSASASAINKSAPTLHLVAKGHTALRVAAVEGKTIVYTEYPPTFAVGDGDALHLDSSLRAGLPIQNGSGFAQPVMSLSGRWPNDLWMTALSWPGRSLWTTTLHRWRNAWQPISTDKHPMQYEDEAVPWSDGRWLSLHAGYGFEHCSFRFVVVEGKTPDVMPEDSQGQRLPGADFGCSRLKPTLGGLRALPTGELFLIGTDNDAGAVERWKPGQKEGTIDRLPGDGIIIPTSIHVRAANDVLVGGRIEKGGKRFPYLARFDGAAWKIEDVPGDISIISVAGTSEGDTWIAESTFDNQGPALFVRFSGHDGAVYHRPAGGVFQRVPFPSGLSSKLQPAAIVSYGGQIWVEAGLDRSDVKEGEAKAFLFRTRPLESVVDFTNLSTKGQVLAGDLRPVTPDCDKVFVVLYTLSEDAPPEYDFPATRKALAGHSEFEGTRFVETDDGQRRYFGAFVKNVEMGNTLSGVIRKSMPTARPQVLCGEPPRVRRTLNIDLKTGQLKP